MQHTATKQDFNRNNLKWEMEIEMKKGWKTVGGNDKQGYCEDENWGPFSLFGSSLDSFNVEREQNECTYLYI